MNGQRGIRLLLADVDGTLVTRDKVLTEATKAAATELHDAGLVLAITSGRPPRGMSMLIEPLNLQAPIARRTLQLMLDHDLDAWIYTADDWFIRDKYAPHVARETSTVRFEAKVVTSFNDEHLARAVKIVGVSDDLRLVNYCEEVAQRTLGKTASAARSQPYYLDVTHPKANKGTVVTTLSKFFDIRPDQIATIGDMPNDVSMFRESGFSIAMGNSSDEVKSQAGAVTDTNENEGFAKAVRKFVLRSTIT